VLHWTVQDDVALPARQGWNFQIAGILVLVEVGAWLVPASREVSTALLRGRLLGENSGEIIHHRGRFPGLINHRLAALGVDNRQAAANYFHGEPASSGGRDARRRT
jgi:hypothetical protein